FYSDDTISFDSASHEVRVTDPTGNVLAFNDFSAAVTANQRGLFKRYTDRDGNAVAVLGYDANGHITEVQRSAVVSGVTVTESWLSTYLTSGPGAGQLGNVKLRRQTNGGAWTVV